MINGRPSAAWGDDLKPLYCSGEIINISMNGLSALYIPPTLYLLGDNARPKAALITI